MPEGCSHAKFDRSRRSGTSDLTRTLDIEFYDPTELQNDSVYQNHLDNDDALSDPSHWGAIKGWLTSSLVDNGPPADPRVGLTPGKIMTRIHNHIENWPATGKEQLRKILVEFISQSTSPPHSLIFRWKIGSTVNGIEYVAVASDGTTSPVNPAAPVIPQFNADEALQVTFVNTTAQIRVEGKETFVDV